MPDGRAVSTSHWESLRADEARADGQDEYERVTAVRIEHLVQVDQPLVLISQAPRSEAPS
jgi:hypothetical protein